ncbi:type II secretion system minor pseudopilin GspH [Spongorhabdus nitratireducens]
MPHSRLPHSRGFTLLEIMLVLMLLGLSASLIIPSLPTGSGSAQLQEQADKFASLARAARQQALIEGRSLGIAVENKSHGYHFLSVEHGQWKKINQSRLFKAAALPDDISIAITPGDSFWQEAIELEQSDDHTLAEWTPVTFDLEPTENSQPESLFSHSPDQKKSPDIVFWSSGEISPVQVSFCIKPGRKLCRQITLEETGQIGTEVAADA